MSKISVLSAKDVASKHKCDMVIVIGINKDLSGSIATYGQTLKLCKIAGEIGQQRLGEIIFGEQGIVDEFSESLIYE